MPPLETVDLPAVEILAANVPIHGIGSPPEGDIFTTDDLRAIAQANRELQGEINPPAKIGHGRSPEPAVGWLGNIRVSDDGTKLLTDLTNVPRRFADLVEKRAYRHRSVELAKVTSQKTGKTHPWVVTGLAWLGAKLPAVRTLDDVVKLYETSPGVEHVLTVVDDENPDFADRAFEALVDLAARATDPAPPETPSASDGRPVNSYTDSQKRAFAEATGLEPDTVTDEMLEKAGVPTEGTPAVDATVDPAQDDRKFEEAVADLRREFTDKIEAADAKADAAQEELRLERRRSFVQDTLKAGRLDPAGREKLEQLFDKDPDLARSFVEALPVQEHLVREFGSDEAGDPGEAGDDVARAFEADLARRMGVKTEELI